MTSGKQAQSCKHIRLHTGGGRSSGGFLGLSHGHSRSTRLRLQQHEPGCHPETSAQWTSPLFLSHPVAAPGTCPAWESNRELVGRCSTMGPRQPGSASTRDETERLSEEAAGRAEGLVWAPVSCEDSTSAPDTCPTAAGEARGPACDTGCTGEAGPGHLKFPSFLGRWGPAGLRVANSPPSRSQDSCRRCRRRPLPGTRAV